MPMRRGFAAYQLPAIVWAALIFVASSIPGTEYPEINIAGIDKVVHFAIYAILCLLTYNAVKHQDLFPRLARRAMSVSMLLTTLYGLTDELHQLAVPGRSCDVWDLAADILGCLLCLLIVWGRDRFVSRSETAGGS